MHVFIVFANSKGLVMGLGSNAARECLFFQYREKADSNDLPAVVRTEEMATRSAACVDP